MARGQHGPPVARGAARPEGDRGQPDRAAPRVAAEALRGGLPRHGLAARVGRARRDRGREGDLRGRDGARRRAADPERPRHRPARSRAHPSRQRGAAPPLHPADALRRGDLVPGLQRARRRQRPRRAAHQRRDRRRRLRAERSEDLDDLRPVGGLDLRPRTHRLERPLRRHLVHPLQARHARRDRPPLRQITGESEFGEVFFEDARVPREPRRPDRRRLAHRHDRARVRARRASPPRSATAAISACSRRRARRSAARAAPCARSSAASSSRTR